MAWITIDEKIYEIASEEERLATEYLHRVFIKAGRPNRLSSESAWKVMDAIMQIWGGLFPHELAAFIDVLKEEQRGERTINEANKVDGGYFPISYPTRLLHMLKVYFPKERFQDHSLIKKMVKRYPVLKRTKYEI